MIGRANSARIPQSSSFHRARSNEAGSSDASKSRQTYQLLLVLGLPVCRGIRQGYLVYRSQERQQCSKRKHEERHRIDLEHRETEEECQRSQKAVPFPHQLACQEQHTKGQLIGGSGLGVIAGCGGGELFGSRLILMLGSNKLYHQIGKGLRNDFRLSKIEMCSWF